MPLIIPLGSRHAPIGVTDVPVSDSVAVATLEGAVPAASLAPPTVVAMQMLGRVAIVGTASLGELLPLAADEAVAVSGDMNREQYDSPVLSVTDVAYLNSIERAGQDDAAVGLGETAWAGLQESWTAMPDTLADVNGTHSWSRLVGTKWSVRGERAMLAGPTAGEGFQVARCETDLGTSDYEVFGTAIIDPADATLVVAGVLARVNDAGTAFYQLRVVNWGGSQAVDCWRNTVADGWVRLCPPIARPIASGVQLRLYVAGSGPVTVIGWLDQDLVVGPLDDGAGAITSGSKIGLFGDWTGGTQATVGLDDIRVRTLGTGTSAYELPVVDATGLGLGERGVLQRGWNVAEALKLPRFVGYGLSPGAQLPGPGPDELYDIIPVSGADGPTVALLERAAPMAGLTSGEAVAVSLGGEEAASAPVQYPDLLSIGWSELGVATLFPGSSEAIAAALAERATALDGLILLGPLPSTVAVGTLAAAAVAVITSGPLGPIREVNEGIGVSGVTGEGITVAGPTGESVTGGT